MQTEHNIIVRYREAHEKAQATLCELMDIHHEFTEKIIPVFCTKIERHDKRNAKNKTRLGVLGIGFGLGFAAATGALSTAAIPVCSGMSFIANVRCNALKDNKKKYAKELFEKEHEARKRFLEAAMHAIEAGRELLAAFPDLKGRLGDGGVTTVAKAVVAFPGLAKELASHAALELLLHLVVEHPETAGNLAIGAAGEAFHAAEFLGPDLLLHFIENAGEIIFGASMLFQVVRVASINHKSPDADSVRALYAESCDHFEKMVPLINIFLGDNLIPINTMKMITGYNLIPSGTIVSSNLSCGNPRGVIQQYNSQTETYVMQQEDSEEVIAVKPDKLLQHINVTLHGFTAMEETKLNGQAGKIYAWCPDQQSYGIHVTALSENWWVGPQHVILKSGTVGQICGVLTKPELNGKWGTIQKWDPNNNRYNIQLSQNQIISIKVENIRV